MATTLGLLTNERDANDRHRREAASVRRGTSQSPNVRLYQAPPYTYHHATRLSLVVSSTRSVLQQMLPDPLVCREARCEIFILDAPAVTGLRPYREAGVVIPVEYMGRSGGHVALEYVTSDDSLCAGREIWGYPKWLAHVDIAVHRREADGQLWIAGRRALTVHLSSREDSDVPELVLQPRFQVRTVESPLGGPAERELVVVGLTSGAPESVQACQASFEVDPHPRNPLRALRSGRVVGAAVRRGTFVLPFASELVKLPRQ